MALRGHASIQGSTDIPTLFNILPGYLPMPHAAPAPRPRRVRRRRRRQDRLLGQHAVLRGQPAQVLLGRRGDRGERLLLRLPAAAHRRPLDLHHGEVGQIEGAARATSWSGENPAVGSANGKMQRLGHGQPRLAGRPRPADDRVGDVLEGRPGDRDRRAGHRGDRHRGLLPPGGLPRREGRARSPRPSGCCSGATRRSTRRATPAASWTSTSSSASGSARSSPGSTDEMDRPLLDLTWDYPDRRAAAEPDGRGGAARDQRHRARRRGAVVVHRAEGRRLDRLRLLDLLRRLRRRGQPGRAPQAALGAGPRSPPSGAGCGRRTGGSSTTAPRPTPTASRGASARSTSGGTRSSGKWTGSDVPDFIADRPPDYVPRRAPAGPDAIGGQDPFIMQTDGKAWLYAPLGLADGPLPTHYEPPESPVHNPLYGQQNNPARRKLVDAVEPDQPELQRGVPVRVHHLPADRAPHGGRDEPHAALPHRAAAGAVLRGLAAAGRASAASSTCGWATIVTARTAIEARVLVTERLRSLRLGDQLVEQVGPALPLGPQRHHPGDSPNDLVNVTMDPNVYIQDKVGTCDIRPGRRPRGRGADGVRRGLPARAPGSTGRPDRRRRRPDEPERSLWGRLDDVAGDAGYDGPPAADGLLHRHLGVHRLQGLRGRVQGVERGPRGRLPAHRHVLRQHPGARAPAPGATWRSSRSRCDVDHHRPRPAGHGRAGAARTRATASGDGGVRWLMSSDVCKHCTHAACLDVCPTGSLFRTEFGTVVVQPDICNGCGYCVPACPYGVIDLRKEDGRAFKCTLCYDRLKEGQTPACAQACPTESIQFGEVDELRERADQRVAELHEQGRRRRPALRRATPTTASAATARSSCCSTSRRSTACRRTRSSPPATSARCGSTSAPRPPPWSGSASPRSSGRRR